MQKFDALKYFKEELQDRVNTLNILEIAQHSNNPQLEIEVCRTLLDIFNIVKDVEETRWARTPLSNSNKNLSWLVSSKIYPLLFKIKDTSGASLIDYDFIKNSIHERSKKSHIENVAKFMQKLDYFDDSEKNALALLSEALFLLVTHYSPNKRRAKVTDNFFCTYCYRERNLSSDTCEMHSGVNRTKGKRNFKRYVDMKNAINIYETGYGVRNLRVFNQLAIYELRKRKICLWSEAKDKSSWINEVITLLGIHDDLWKIKNKTKELLKLSAKDDLSYFPNWPSSLNGTMFRYQAYILATCRKPSLKMVYKLNQVWSGKKITEVAKSSSIQRSGLQRAVLNWKNKINNLRHKQVPDELIKVALGLEYLPIIKTGGAANKKSPQRF